MALKGFATSLAMAWLMQTTGIVIITNYASLIFDKSGTSLSVNASSIMLAVMQIVGGLVSTQLGDLSRKTTLYISLSSSAFGLFTFSLYSYLRHSNYDVSHFLWLPVTSLSFIIFTSSAGIVAVCNTCALENFSPKVSIKTKFIFQFSLVVLNLTKPLFLDSTGWRYVLLFVPQCSRFSRR